MLDANLEVHEGFGELGAQLPAAATAALSSLARYGRFSIEAMVEGAWAVFLAHRTGARDVQFGITVSESDTPAGPLRHTFPLRAAVEPETPLLSLLRKLQDLHVAGRKQGDVPLSQVPAWSPVGGSAPRFNSRLVFGSQPARGEGGEIERAEVPLTLAVRPGTELALTLTYDRARWTGAEAALVLEHVKALLEKFAADPLQRLGDLEGVGGAPLKLSSEPAPAAPEKPAARQAPAAAPASPAPAGDLVPVPRDQPLPATFYQEWALQLDRVETNNLPTALSIEGQIDFTALRRTLAEISRRQESLRTSFVWEAGEARLVIARPAEVPLPVIDISALPAERQPAVLDGLIAQNTEHVFDMARGPLFIARMVRLGPRQHAMLVCVHHLISDGWSLQVFQRELFTLYSAYTQGRPSPLPELTVQAADFAHWQRRIFAGEALAAQLAWWRNALSNLPPPPALPIDRPRPEVVGNRCVFQQAEVQPEPTQALRAFAQASRCSLSMVLLAAVDALLYTYSGEEDLIVSSIFAARNRRELAGLIGLFMNTVPLRVRLEGNPTFRGLTGRVRDAMVESYDHQDVPFPRLLAELFPGRKTTRTILSGVCFNMLTFQKSAAAPAGGGPAGGGLILRPLSGSEDVTKHDLVVSGQEAETTLVFSLQGATDLFTSERLQEVANRFEALLNRVAADPDIPLDRLRSELSGAAPATPG
jgi:non-ribosomal peptide synthetase component F